MKKGIASACGSATIINAIASGRGAAFALDLRIKAIVKLSKNISEIRGKIRDSDEDPNLIEISVKKVLEKERISKNFGAQIETTSEIPTATGLSSSSCAANATVLATYNALDIEPDPLEAINLGIEAAFEANTTVTGAFDDASASYLGGGTITDNEKKRILGKFNVDPSLRVLIHLPPGRSYTTKIDVAKTRLLRDLATYTHEVALKGNIYGAQTLNGLLYSSLLNRDPCPALKAIDAGALSAGLTGTGPATVAISKEEKVEDIIDLWNTAEGKILKTKPSLEGAKVEDG